MAITNYLCDTCSKAEVCKISDILCKFHEDAKKQLGVNITIDRCLYFTTEDEDGE